MDDDGIRCDSCRSSSVSVAINVVRPHGKRAVFTCQACGLTWVNTEPTVAEQVIVAATALDPPVA